MIMLLAAIGRYHRSTTKGVLVMTVLSWIVCYSVVAAMLQWVFNQQNIKVAFRTCLIQLIMAHVCATVVGFALLFILPEQISMSQYGVIEMVVVALTAFISLTVIMRSIMVFLIRSGLCFTWFSRR